MSDPIGHNVKGKQGVWPMKHKNTNTNEIIEFTDNVFGIVCYLYMREQLGMLHIVNLDIWSQYSGLRSASHKCAILSRVLLLLNIIWIPKILISHDPRLQDSDVVD